MAGRKTVLTPETQATYIKARYRGGNDTDAAYAAGIHPDTVRRWRARLDMAGITTHDDGSITYADDESDPPIEALFVFFEAVKKADADARLSRLQNIERAGNEGTWQADAWWLERRFPEEFGRRDRNVVTMDATVRHETSGEVDPEEELADGRNRLDALLAAAMEIAAVNRPQEEEEA